MDRTAAAIEDVLDRTAPSGGVITVWFSGGVLSLTRIAAWDRAAGVLVCRGGQGYSDDDLHYLRVTAIAGLTLRAPAAPRQEPDRLNADARDAMRHAAGFPIGVALRPDTFSSAPEPLAAWCRNIAEALAAIESQREALRAEVDQILLREGSTVALLGGNTLILEATPESVPAPASIRAAIAALL